MKCDNCGNHNPTGKYYCQKCGHPLSTNSYTSPVRKYKDSAKQGVNKPIFNGKQKFIIAVCVIAVVLLILSSVVPSDLDFTPITDEINDTLNNTPAQIEDSNIQKINTRITSKSVTATADEQVTVSAHVTDENDIAVNSGTTSVNVNGVKYSGQVQNGDANIILPSMTQNTEVTITYEGNDQYNPSQTTTYIEITKISTKFEVENSTNSLIVTLTTSENQPIADATITVTKDNSTTAMQSDADGKITIPIDESVRRIVLKYDGNSKYNSTEKTLEFEVKKIETHISTQYDDENKVVSISLLDSNNNSLGNKTLTLSDNGISQSLQTSSDGFCNYTIMEEGFHEILISYAGNESTNASSASLNLNISNHTNTTPTNHTNHTNHTIHTNHTESKTNTHIKTETNDDNTVLTAKLLTDDDKIISNEHIIIKLSDGKEYEKVTNSEGEITIDLESDIKTVDLSFNGTDKYHSATKIVSIKRFDYATSHSH